MVVDKLTLIMIHEGKRLVEELDESGNAVDAALWFFFPEPEEWKLVISLPELADAGPKAGYGVIQGELEKLEEPQIGLQDIRLGRRNSQIVGLMRTVAKTGSEIRGIRVSKTVVDGHLIDDAYIYRL